MAAEAGALVRAEERSIRSEHHEPADPPEAVHRHLESHKSGPLCSRLVPIPKDRRIVAAAVFGAVVVVLFVIVAIAQGSSEVSISLVVDSTDTETAVKALHELIIQ